MTHSNPCLLCDSCTGIFRSPCILLLCNAVSKFRPCHWREMLKITTVLTRSLWPQFDLLCFFCCPSIFLDLFVRRLVVSELSKVWMNTIYCSYWSLISKVNVVVCSSTRVCLGPAHIRFTPPTKSVNPYPLLAAYTMLNWAACQIYSPGSQCFVSRCSRTNERIRKWWKP